MSTKQNDSTETNILKFRKRRPINIGTIIFGIIFIYLVATVVMYITAPHITVYEVRQGSILKDNAYTGLAIRDEIVVTATESGYINYYALDNSKVKVGSNVYTLSNSKLTFDETDGTESETLTAEEERNVSLNIQQFVYDHKDNNFSDVYNFKSSVKTSLRGYHNQSMWSQLNDMISQGAISDVDVHTAADDGIVVYSVDGMETLTLDTVSMSHFDKSNYRKKEFSNNTKIKSGDDIYKIITSDTWNLLIHLDDETAAQLKEKKSVKVHFNKDDQSMWADFEMKTLDGNNIGVLSFHQAMVRYAAERYLDIELILEDETGLKIPKSAQCIKEFYIVPLSYITTGGNSSNSGVLKKTKDAEGQTIAAFTATTIYYKDEEQQLAYLDPMQFDEKTVILKPDSDETYTLNEKRTLKGVYCINKGYAVFKQIHVLCESDTYYIIEEGNNYGLSNYDHIALDSTNIKENDVVF